MMDDAGNYRGIIADYMHLLEKKLNFKFKLVRADSWSDVLKMARERRVDVISAGVASEARRQYMDWTEPYFQSPIAIISKKSLKGQLDIQRVLNSNLTLGIPADYHTSHLYRENYPGIQVIDTDNLLDGLKKVSFGEIDAVIAEVPHALHYIEKFNIPNLRSAGVSDYETLLSIGTRSDWPILHRIMSKGIAMISESEHREIERRWIKLPPMQLHQFRTFWYIVFFLLLVTGIILLWSTSLKKQVRKRTEEYRFSEKLFRDLVENSPTGIAIIQDGKVVYTNPEQKRLPEVIIPVELDSLAHIPGEDRAKAETFFRGIQSIQTDPRETDFLETDFGFYIHPKGKEKFKEMRYVNCRACRIMYRGRPGVLLNTIDRSRSKKMEKLLVTQEKMVSLGHICAGIAHEVRNPLAAINVHLGNLEEMYSADARHASNIRTCFRLIHSDSERIESVIRRTLDFAKPINPKFAKIDLNVPLKRAVRLTETTLRHKRIRIQFHPLNPPVFCFGESRLIEDVVYNLIINASDAMGGMEGHKQIFVIVYANRRHAVAVVDDNGPGVPPDLREKIFDPFVTTKKSSTGIGLSICRRILADHDGSLKAMSNPLKGGRFVIKIPIYNGQTESDRRYAS